MLNAREGEESLAIVNCLKKHYKIHFTNGNGLRWLLNDLNSFHSLIYNNISNNKIRSMLSNFEMKFNQ